MINFSIISFTVTFLVILISFSQSTVPSFLFCLFYLLLFFLEFKANVFGIEIYSDIKITIFLYFLIQTENSCIDSL